MSPNLADTRDAETVDAALLIADAAAAAARARVLRAAAARDFLIGDDARLDDRSRAALATLLRAIVGTLGGDVHGRALDLLAGRSAARAALDAVEARAICAPVHARLLGDDGAAATLLDRVALDLLAERLPESLIERAEGDDPFDSADPAVQACAAALRAAESRRRGAVDQPPYPIDLDAEMQHRCVWTITAAIAGATVTKDAADRVAIERALADAAQQVLAGHDEELRLEAAAMRFAVMRDLPPTRLAEAIEIALADRRIVLVAALIAHGLGIAFDDVRAMLADARDTRLWLCLRALDLPQATVARIGYALSEADPRRDAEAFADGIEAIMEIAPARARTLLARLRLPAAFRQAIEDLR